MEMLFIKNISDKQAVDPWHTSLISKHTNLIFRNQIFHSGFHLSLKVSRIFTSHQ